MSAENVGRVRAVYAEWAKGNFRQHGVGKGSGVEVEQTYYSVWRFRDGLVVSVRWDDTRERALDAAGLSE